MNFELAEEHRMVVDLVRRFVDDELMPIENAVLEQEACGGETVLDKKTTARIDERSRQLGLWGMDAPEEFGGADLRHVAIAAVNMELGRTITPYTFPPDSPNLRMMVETATPAQQERYFGPTWKARRSRRSASRNPAPDRTPDGCARAQPARTAAGC